MPWRYVRHPDGSEELYRITDDPFELTDVAAKHPDRVAEFGRRADAHLAELLAPPAHGEVLGRVTDDPHGKHDGENFGVSARGHRSVRRTPA